MIILFDKDNSYLLAVWKLAKFLKCEVMTGKNNPTLFNWFEKKEREALLATF